MDLRQLLVACAAYAAMQAGAVASEVVLYDNADCTGPSRTLITSEPDLARIEFGNDAASVQVIAGAWTFYRDPFFQTNNGPPFTLEPGACLNLGTGPAAQFPPELMDSVELIQSAPGPDAAIALFDGVNFAPPYRVLTGDATDLNAAEFDNRADSFRVLSGSWLIYPDVGFGGAPTDGAGAVSDVLDLGLARNSASSVHRFVSEPTPPSPPRVVTVTCPEGSATNATGTACVDCAANGLVTAPDSRSCICPPGQINAGLRSVDGVAVAICRREISVPRPPSPPTRRSPGSNELACTGNEVFVGTPEAGGGCLPCPEETEPDPTHEFCRCLDGYVQTGIGSGGFPTCNPPSGGAGLGRFEIVAPASEFFAILRDRGFPLTTDGPIGAPCQVLIGSSNVVFEHGTPIPPALGGISFCDIHLFNSAKLNDGWAFVGFGRMTPNCRWPAWRGPTHTIKRSLSDPAGLGHTIRVFAEFPTNPLCQVSVSNVLLHGPSQRWKEAVLGPPWDGPIDFDPI